MKDQRKPRRINWIVRCSGQALEEWLAFDERLQKHGRVCRGRVGNWLWTSGLALCGGSAPKRGMAMAECEKAIMRNSREVES